jgi:hypothetical protein
MPEGKMLISDTPEKILERWMEYVNKLEVQSVVDLYDDKSMLLPTFSPHCISNPQQIKEYFMQLSTRKDMRVELHQGTIRKAKIGENKYIVTGIYSFQFVVDDANLTFPSRFTFVLDVSSAKPIIHHHSSQIPRTLS